MTTHPKCPKCGSIAVGLCTDGQYECLDCCYIGPIAQRGPRKIKALPADKE